MDPGDLQERVLMSIRAPRVVAGLVIGAVLAAAGAAYQTIFRNPLVSPDVLGVSAGAGVGAILGILLGVHIGLIQFFAFAGGLLTVGIVGFIAASIRARDPILLLVLGGVVVGALAGAAISLMKILADPYDQLPAITFWLLGSLSSVRVYDIVAILPLAMFGLMPLYLLRWRIDILSMGDEEAKALGVHVSQLRLLIIGAATLMTASVVALAGVIGWIGLVIPHIARMLVGPAFSRLLPAAMALGATYLVVVDTLARSLARIEIPLGILTAVIGAPFFLWLLWRGRHEA
jgi:iron complex transport system permease protein